jgi:hypothetical protein
VTQRCRKPEVKSIATNVRYGEPACTGLVAAVHNVSETTKTEDAIAATGRVPAILCRCRDNTLRIWNDEVVARLIASEQASSNPLDASYVPCLLLWRERFQNHVILVITTDTHARVIYRNDNICASDRLQLRN